MFDITDTSHSLYWFLYDGAEQQQQVSQTEVVTPEVPDHVTVGRSCDQTGSKSSRDPSRDQAPKKALTLSDKESEDKERKHAWMHAYFCRCNLCYVHDRY